MLLLLKAFMVGPFPGSPGGIFRTVSSTFMMEFSRKRIWAAWRAAVLSAQGHYHRSKMNAVPLVEKLCEVQKSV